MILVLGDKTMTMKRFFGSTQGSGGESTRTGTRSSGIQARINGWYVGCEAFMGVDCDNEDIVTIYLSGGSHHSNKPVRLLGTFRATDLEETLDEIIVEVRGGVAYCTDKRVKIIDRDK